MRGDRTVHAQGRGFEVVRYNRAGRWYVEGSKDRRQANLDQAVREAVHLAASVGGAVRLRQPGGSAFDRQLRRHVESKQA